MQSSYSFKLIDESIGKDDSLYRGEQIPFEHLTKLIISIKRVEAKRVVIDSITILEMQYSDQFHTRQGLQGLVQVLESVVYHLFYYLKQLMINKFHQSGLYHLE